MIEKLTPEQEEQINVYRKRFFDAAISTETDRERAAKAALELAEIVGVKNCRVEHVTTPPMWTTLGGPSGNSTKDCLNNSLDKVIHKSLGNHIKGSLWHSIWDSLYVSIWDLVFNSLPITLLDSLRDSLDGSICNSLRDSSLTTLALYIVEQLGVECSDENRRILELSRDIVESCFAVWITHNSIVICDKPTSVVVESKLVDVQWGETK